MTTLDEEKFEQQTWTARLRRPVPAYDRLLEREFETPEEQNAHVEQSLGAMLRFASRGVRHYRDAFRHAGIVASDTDPTKLLAALPILTKLDIQDAGSALRADTLPPGERPGGWAQSSGTTGTPTRVLHSIRSASMSTLLKQREYRWFRLDPSGALAAMRLGSQLPRKADGSEIGVGEIARLEAWPHMDNFQTGPFAAMSVFTPTDERIAWMRRECPDYLMTFSETLEHVALAAGDQRPAESLKAVLSISEELTPSMRGYVERRFGTPVYQNYGLNEIGLVATRCNAGRYHVHNEHCLVEIVDDAGRACAPGETGRVVVTSLTNFAMPLIRYDSGDLAETISGDCPCGRTLPSFGEIAGRYGRIVFLPKGTIIVVAALRDAIEKMPTDLVRDLREFQIHQYTDRRMELRLVTRALLPEAFFETLRAAWARESGPGAPDLSFRAVNEIPRSPGGKSQVFTSDFVPARDSERRLRPRAGK
jgi:phenylacetate-CoA ligase